MPSDGLFTLYKYAVVTRSLFPKIEQPHWFYGNMLEISYTIPGFTSYLLLHNGTHLKEEVVNQRLKCGDQLPQESHTDEN